MPPRRIYSPIHRQPSPPIGARGTVPVRPDWGLLTIVDDRDPALLTVRNRRGAEFRIGKRAFQPEPATESTETTIGTAL